VGIAGFTPQRWATAGYTWMSAKSRPGTWVDVRLANVPTSTSVVVSTCMITRWPVRSEQWLAVPT
jgi:hypothetical protein